jgi:hypothetical protein
MSALGKQNLCENQLKDFNSLHAQMISSLAVNRPSNKLL